MPRFTRRTELDHPVEEVFAWHTRPGAFERLAPPWEGMRVIERSNPNLEPGTRVQLAFRRGPAEIRWELEHVALEQNRLFVDEQVSGPFRRWRHEHHFEPLPGRHSAVVDVVDWDVPLGGAGEALSSGLVERAMDRAFAFRARRLANDLSLLTTHADHPRLRVAVTGSTGLIGTALVAFLRAGGHEVRRMRRNGSGSPDSLRWDPEAGRIDRDGLEGLDAVVHLAGEPIAGIRWTTAKKEAILRSREEGTGLLARTLADLDAPPGVFLSASGIDFYGDRGDVIVTEDDAGGEGFLAGVVRRWERATDPAREAGIRTLQTRNAAVLSPLGGMLGTILLPFNLGLGGRLGSGRQYVSWIDLDDEVGLIHHALRTPELRGPVNASSPNPVPNRSFTDVLGRVLGRPTVLPLPALAVRAMLGEMGRELLLRGRRAIPDRALRTGYEFLFADLEDSLRHQLGRVE